MKLGGDYMANDDIRYEAARRGVRLWQIAEAIGINDGNFSRKLRHELPAEDKARILEAIRSVADGKGADRND